MQALGNTFRKNGYLFRLMQRIGDIAIYEQLEPSDNRVVAIEVFEVIKVKEQNIFGKDIPGHEICPSNEQWGSKGFTVRNFSRAMEKVGILQDKIDNRNSAEANSK